MPSRPCSRPRFRRLPALLAAAFVSLLALGLAGCAGGTDAAETAPPVHDETVLSKTYEVDRIYRSMKGPYSVQPVRLLESETPELLWITGYRAVMVASDGETPKPQEFMCHSNLDIDLAAHRKAIPTTHAFSARLFTLSQGQLEIDFPVGFGIPVLSTQPLNLTTQVLNLNHPDVKEEIRHRVTIRYVRDAEVTRPMKALFPAGAYGLAVLEGEAGYFGEASPDSEDHGPGCLAAPNADSHVYNDPLGRKFTGHWVVKPGREENRTLVTHLMGLPYDTAIHYIAVHLHPFAESLELRDLTTGESLFKSKARGFPDKIGLAKVDSLTSVEGIPVFKDHDYEIVSVYDNTTAEDQDSMAVMYLYLEDKSFDPAQVKALRTADARLGG